MRSSSVTLQSSCADVIHVALARDMQTYVPERPPGAVTVNATGPPSGWLLLAEAAGWAAPGCVRRLRPRRVSELGLEPRQRCLAKIELEAFGGRARHDVRNVGH